MRRFWIILLALAMMGLSGCNTPQKTPPATTVPAIQEPDIAPNTPVPFHVQYIRTNGGDSMEFPGVTLIDSKKALDDYYATYKEVYNLERQFQLYSDTTMGFLDACDKYDAPFFEEKYLIFVTLEVGSGSVRHNVTSVEQNSQRKIEISIDSVLPGGVGTSDMAQWHIILELDHDYWISSPNMVMVYWNDRLAYDGVAIASPNPEKVYETPPGGSVITPESVSGLRPGGYSWFCGDMAVIADTNTYPAKESMEPVTISEEFAETVYIYQEETSIYEATNSLGYMVKLQWESEPSSIKLTCWPDTIWDDPDTSAEEVMIYKDSVFYAKYGGYLYRISATWEDTGRGYHGSVDYFVYMLGGVHTHMTALEPQVIDDPVTGYCGNTQSTVYMDGKEYTFMGGYSVTLTDILINLDYDPVRLCRCRPEYTVNTEFGTGYGIHLTQGYARCEKGQADLTVEQIRKIQEILDWLEATGGQY